MAKNNNNKLNYNGKEISNDTAYQLEQTNKQLKETIKLEKEYVKQLKEQGRIADDIYKKKQAQYNMDRKAQKVMEDGIKLNRKQQEELIKDAEKNKDIITRSIANANKSKPPSSLNDWYARRTEQNYNKAYQEIADKYYQQYSNNGKKSLNQSQYTKMQKDIENEFTEGLKDGTIKFGKHTDTFALATKVFKTAVDTWVSVAKTGLNNQYNAYENSFENISVRNGVERTQYTRAQRRANNILSDLGLRNNVATSEIQNMWNTMATNGVVIDMSTEKARAEVTANAIEAILTKKIVPYLDTDSQELQILNSRLDGRFFKDIRGINIANNEIAGNNYATKELLQTIIDQVQPMSDKALEDLAQGSAELTAYANYLMSEEGGSLTKSQATNIITQIFRQQKYSDQIMRSGSVYDKMALISNFRTNIYDPKNYNNATGNIVDVGQTLTGMMPGYGSTMDGVLTNMMGTSLGLGFDDINAINKITGAGKTGSGIAGLTDFTPEQLKKYADEATNDYKNDKNQTQTRLQDVTLENLMNELAAGKQGLGHWTDVIVTAIKGIGTILTAKVIGGTIGKGMGLLSGLSGASLPSMGGIGAALGVAGPIALGIGAVAGTVALINAKIAQKNEQGRQDHIGNTEGTYQASIDEGNTESQARADAWGSYEHTNIGIFQNSGEVYGGFNTREKLPNGQWYNKASSWSEYVNNDKVKFNANAPGGILGAFSGQSGELRDEFGFEKHWWMDGSEEAKAALEKYRKAYDRYNYNRIKVFGLATLLDQNNSIPFNIAMAALSAAVIHGKHTNDNDIMGPLNDGTYGFNGNVLTDKKLLMDTMAASGITEAKDLSAIYRLLKESTVDFWLMAPGKDKWMGFPSTEELKSEFNLHRYGLNKVPYDEYPAMLHEGEAVLTASTANTLRDLLEEYRNTSTQSVNFDTIIQAQTEALINKMSEIISVMSNSNIGETILNANSNNPAKQLIHKSMKHVVSTKSF